MFRAEIKAKDLALATRKLSVLARTGTIPILNHVWLRSEGGKILATTTNLDEAITIALDGSGEGSRTVDVRRLSHFAKLLPSDATVTLSDDGGGIITGNMMARSGSVEHQIPSLDAKDFPTQVADTIDPKQAWGVDGGWLKAIISASSFVMEKGPILRPFMHGLHVEYGKSPHVNAAERFGLFRSSAHAFLSEQSGSFMVPTEVVRLLSDIVGDETVTVALAKTDSAFSVSSGNTTIRSKLIALETAPTHANFLPSQKAVTFTGDAETLLATIEAGSLPDHKRITVEMTGEDFKISARHGSDGTTSAECQIFDVEGSSCKFNIDNGVLKWAIESLDCETVSASVSPEESKIVFTKNGEPDSIRMAMMYGK